MRTTTTTTVFLTTLSNRWTERYRLAAQAYIFERTDKTAQSHHGVQTEFFRPTKDDDDSVGPDAVISQAESIAAVATAKRFVDHLMSIVHVVDVAPDTDCRVTRRAIA